MSMGYTKALTVDTDTTFAGNSTTGVPSQSAVKNLYDNVNVANAAYIKTALNASGSAPIYAARAWVTWGTVTTTAIIASGNVSSLTDNGAGDTTINFATAMSDANYSYSASGPTANGRAVMLYNGTFNTSDASSAKTTTTCRFFQASMNGGGVGLDCTPLSAAFFN